MRVRVFSSCMTGIHYPGVAPAALNVLEALGVEAAPLGGVTCCGQAFFNSGHPDLARKVGRRLFKSISGSEDPVVMVSGSCAHFVREHYPGLFGAKATLGEKCFEFTEFISRKLSADIRGTLKKPLRAAYHPSCHLLRGLALRGEPFKVLHGIENLELVHIEKEETCCGFGGIFSAVYPEVSARMAAEKLQTLKKAGASAFICADAGCMKRMENDGIRAIHITEILRDGLIG